MLFLSACDAGFDLSFAESVETPSAASVKESFAMFWGCLFPLSVSSLLSFEEEGEGEEGKGYWWPVGDD